MSGDHHLGRRREATIRKQYWRPRHHDGHPDALDQVNVTVPWLFMIRHDWDRILLDLSFIAFGIWGLIFTWTTPLPVYTALVRTTYSIFDVQFLIVGTLLLVAHRRGSRRIRWIAYQIYVMALVLLAIVVFTASSSPFAILILGFALHGVILGRLTRRQEQTKARVSRMIAEDDLSPM